MAVYKDKKRGTWYAMIRYTDDEGQRKSKMKRGFELKRDAINYEHEFRKNLNNPKQSTRFKDVFNQLMEKRKPTVKSKTISDYEHKSKLYFSEIDNIRIDRLTNKKIQETVNAIKSSDKSRKTKNESLTLLKSTLAYANTIYDTNFKTQLIESIPKSYDDIKPHDTWLDSEFNQFIEKVENQVYKAFFTFLYRTGARKQEAIDLTWDRVNENSVQFINTKTLSSNRTILIDNDTLSQMKAIKHGDYVFGGDFPLATSTIHRVWTQAIKDSGVKKIRVHDLRHSHATNLINKGANIVAVSKRLGHSDTSMTLRVYTHLLEKTEEELLEYI